MLEQNLALVVHSIGAATADHLACATIARCSRLCGRTQAADKRTQLPASLLHSAHAKSSAPSALPAPHGGAQYPHGGASAD
jgi:hypothetical protein